MNDVVRFPGPQSAAPADGAMRSRSNSGMLLSIVAAFHNEEKMVGALFDELERVAETLDCEVEFVCVNDGSADKTLALLCARHVMNKRIRIINLARNFGKEAAISAGLAHAKGDAAVIIDADLQDPPSVIPQFVEKWREGYDVVYGVRTCRKVDSWTKRFTANAFYKIFNRLTDVSIPEGAGDFRLLDRRAIDALLSMPERNRFMKGLFSWVGFSQVGVDYIRAPRAAGETKWNYFKLINLAVDGVTSFTIAPLRVASFSGIVVSLLGFAYAAFLVARTLIYGVDVPGYASVMVVTIFLGGVQLFCLGVMGEYLGRMYKEAKGRPLYIVADVIQSPEAARTRRRRAKASSERALAQKPAPDEVHSRHS